MGVLMHMTQVEWGLVSCASAITMRKAYPRYVGSTRAELPPGQSLVKSRLVANSKKQVHLQGEIKHR